MADLGRLLKKASAQMSRHFGAFAKRYRLTAVQMSLIDFLVTHRDREIDQRDVEREFLIRRSTASILLKRMERRGLLTRTPGLHDARQRRVRLTARALGLEKVIVGYMLAQQARLRSRFTPGEIKLLFRLLKTVIRLNQ